MGKRRNRRIVEFTVLNALGLSTLPKPHQIASVASQLLSNGDVWPDVIRGSRQIANLLTDSEESAAILIVDILEEAKRQCSIKIRRTGTRQEIESALASGSQLSREERVRRLCKSLFGDPDQWVPAAGVGSRIKEPQFDWFRRMKDGVLVGGFVGTEVRSNDPVSGFAFFDRQSPLRYGLLPRRTTSIEDLLSLLGLHPRLIGRSDVKIDWSRRTFVVSNSNHLPWIYP